MLKSFCKLSSRGLGGPIQSFVFFALFYLYLWLIIEPRLIYHGGGIISNFPVFLRGWMFFCEFLFYPGGLVEYISAFLSQFFYYSWTGAFVVTLQAWLICTCFDYFFKAVDAPHFRWLSFVPALLLLVVYNQYTYHFTTTMALLIAMAFVCLYLKINPKNELPGLAVFLVMSVVLYYLVAGAYLLFALLCAIYELLLAPKKLHDAGPFRHRWRLGLVYLLSALLIPYIMGVLIFGASIVNAFGDLLPLSPEVLSFVFHLVLVVVVVLVLRLLYWIVALLCNYQMDFPL